MTRDVAIVGAGIGGLATALLLGRQGRDVVVCERDPAPVPRSADAMWSDWPRPGTPQARLGHAFLSGFRALMSERAPDVLARLQAAGAPLVDYAVDLPGGERRPEDDDLKVIMCRRAVLEGVLRQAVEAEPTVEIRGGWEAGGFVTEPSATPGVPTIVGIRSRGAEVIAADTVVLAGGRTLPVGRWFEAAGAAPPAEFAEGCGLLCYTRYFQIHLRPGEDHTVATRLTVEQHPSFLGYEIFGADGGTFCVELEPAASDHALRALRDSDVHTAVCRALPEIGDWLDPERSSPIGPVAAMGQERNLLRRFVANGRPLALGVHVIGDVRCQTNSLYAWGSAMALQQAVALVDVLGDHPGDHEAQALALESRVAAEVTGRHEYSLARDRALMRRARGEPQWEHPNAGRELILHSVIPAAEHDPEVFRAVRRWELQLDAVGALEQNAAVVERARALGLSSAPADTAVAPTRDTVLEIIRRSGDEAARSSGPPAS